MDGLCDDYIVVNAVSNETFNGSSYRMNLTAER
jgi:hypothetical protein